MGDFDSPHRGPIPRGAAICAVSLTERTGGYEPSDVGSTPARRAKRLSLLVE